MRTRDAKGALERLPGGHPLERMLLRGLVDREGSNDYLGALKCVSTSGLAPAVSRVIVLCFCPDTIQLSSDVCAQLSEPGLE